MTCKDHLRLARKAFKKSSKHMTTYRKGGRLEQLKMSNAYVREVQSHLAQARFKAELERQHDKVK